MTEDDWLGLRQRRVLVAGAGGIGAACATAFARSGATVAVTDLDVDRLAQLGDQAAEEGARFVTIPGDLRDPLEAPRVVASATDQLGGLDVCVHAVGINVRKPVLDYSPDEWAQTVDVNLSTAFWLASAAGRGMVEQGSGRVIFLSSVSGILAHKHHAPYAATKGGINQMMRVMATEWASHGVTVNAVAPGYVETSLTRDYLERDGNRERLTSLVPAGRLGGTDEVTGPVLFLASKQAGFVTGHVLYVDGGRTLV